MLFQREEKRRSLIVMHRDELPPRSKTRQKWNKELVQKYQIIDNISSFNLVYRNIFLLLCWSRLERKRNGTT